MATIVRRKDRDGRPRPYWSYVIVDAQGRRREYRGDPSRRETERLAVEHEARERAIREGLRPRRALLADVIEQYLAWGSAQGGRRGKPWASKHAQTRRVALAEWVSELEVERIEDVRLVDVERVARAWSLRGRSAKTIRNMVEPLHALCRWAVRRELLARDPLAAWTAPKGRPKRARRPLTVDELRRLLSSVPAKRALQYEVALWTGYRFSELLALTPRELADGWIRLDEDASKRRWAESQPIPRELFERLEALAQTLTPTSPLLQIPRSTAGRRQIARDLAAVGITGDVGWHSLRKSYTQLIARHAQDPSTLRELARHASLDLTLERYAMTSDERKRSTVEAAYGAFVDRTSAVVPRSGQRSGRDGTEGVGFEPPARPDDIAQEPDIRRLQGEIVADSGEACDHFDELWEEAVRGAFVAHDPAREMASMADRGTRILRLLRER